MVMQMQTKQEFAPSQTSNEYLLDAVKFFTFASSMAVVSHKNFVRDCLESSSLIAQPQAQ
jgi:hypothetical protein